MLTHHLCPVPFKLIAPIFALALAASPGVAQVDSRFDLESGRSTANYPPPRHFDHLHMLLEIDIPDMDEPRLTARETLTLSSIGSRRSELRLDAVGLQVRAVERAGLPQSFTHDGSVLRIKLDPPVEADEQFQVTIDYGLEYPLGNGLGLTWTAGNPDADALTNRVPQIHSQGEPQLNSRWFACHDFPNESATTEIVVTVDQAYQAIANGRLVYRSPNADGRVTWHWLQDKPHAYYLVSLVIGRFAEIDIGGDDSGRPGLPMTVFTPFGTEAHVAMTFRRTPDMIAYFEALFDEPFPWDKYHQLIVRNFAAGAMENTSATTFATSFARTPLAVTEGIIAHELTHQWFGDLVTCKSWEHLWLNEGWASYGEALWAQASAEPGHEREAYLDTIAGFLKRQSGINRSFVPTFPAMASNFYRDPQLVFMKPDDVYSKGALVLHMLHERLGDDIFWRGVRTYLDRYQYRQVETDDFRHVLEEVSGRSLQQFFDQWVHRPGLPRLRVDADYDAGTLQVAIEQTQLIDADNPAYAFSLPIRLVFADGSERMIAIDVAGRSAGGSFSMPEPPERIEVNPDITVAAAVRTTYATPGEPR